MVPFHLFAIFGALALSMAVAGAQPSATHPAPGGDTVNVSSFIGRREPGVLRASDFVGRKVYGPENDAIGEVEDVLFGPDGRMSGLVLEVGGLLGIGEREVAVPIHAFRIDPGATATTGSLAGLPPSTPAGAETREDHRISNVVYPERIILPIPLDSIRAAPVFEDTLGRSAR